VELPVRAIREQTARAVDLVVQQARFADGSRRVTHVAEVTGMEGEVIALQDLFVYEPASGLHVSSGFTPRFVEEMRRRGEAVDGSIFRQEAA
jgi:pilus assembly protein CpaF